MYSAGWKITCTLSLPLVTAHCPPPLPPAPCAGPGKPHGRACSPARSPAGATCTAVNPDACATGTPPSAPRIPVHVVPDTACTAHISDGWAGSATWNCCAPYFTAGNDADDVTVHVSAVPAAGAVVPPEETVVDGLLAKTSSGMNAMC